MTFVVSKRGLYKGVFFIVNKGKTHSFIALKRKTSSTGYILSFSAVSISKDYKNFKEVKIQEVPSSIVRQTIKQLFEDLLFRTSLE